MRAVRALRRNLGQAAEARAARRSAVGWRDHSRLLVVGDGADWSLDRDAEHLVATAGRLGLPTAPGAWAAHLERQSVFLTSHFAAVAPCWLQSSHRLATSWFHGLPDTAGYPEFDATFAVLRAQPSRFQRIQVTHPAMRAAVLEAGVAADRVHLIPIGIDLAVFPQATTELRAASRERFGIPPDVFLVGSFQKDGDGWQEGLSPKLVKGPDVLVAALTAAAAELESLWVLLTGPARGYVKAGLTKAEVPFTHVHLPGEADLAAGYHALDAYLIPSRQEGGPKGVLEALACGVPLVSTRVGQATEIVHDGANGLLVDVEDAGGLAAGITRIAGDRALADRLAASGRITAETFDHPLLDPLWRAFFEGFIE
ncbi:MAG: glycosyltransferase family 4 protein [Gaiella sp.]